MHTQTQENWNRALKERVKAVEGGAGRLFRVRTQVSAWLSACLTFTVSLSLWPTRTLMHSRTHEFPRARTHSNARTRVRLSHGAARPVSRTVLDRCLPMHAVTVLQSAAG